MARLKAIISVNSVESYHSAIENFLVKNNIPFELYDNRLYLICNGILEVDIVNSTHPYILTMLSKLPIHFGFDFNPVELYLVQLFDYFNEIVIDINIIESYGGESIWYELKIEDRGQLSVIEND